MIGYLNGKILDHSDGRVLVAVGSSDGSVGYSVTVPESEGHIGLIAGDRVELFIYTHVREDALDLYGFKTAAEKDLFLTLLTVSGIGPKGAMNILSGASMQQLVQAIVQGDKLALGKLQGVGKKTAERIVLELGDKIRKKSDAGVYGAPMHAAASARSASKSAPTGASALVRDAASALVGLGYREQDAESLIQKLMDEAETPPQKVEDLVRSALRHMI